MGATQCLYVDASRINVRILIAIDFKSPYQIVPGEGWLCSPCRTLTVVVVTKVVEEQSLGASLIQWTSSTCSSSSIHWFSDWHKMVLRGRPVLEAILEAAESSPPTDTSVFGIRRNHLRRLDPSPQSSRIRHVVNVLFSILTQTLATYFLTYLLTCLLPDVALRKKCIIAGCKKHRPQFALASTLNEVSYSFNRLP